MRQERSEKLMKVCAYLERCLGKRARTELLKKTDFIQNYIQHLSNALAFFIQSQTLDFNPLSK